MKGERPGRPWLQEVEEYQQVRQRIRERMKRKAQKYVAKQQEKIKKKVKFKKGDLVIVKALRTSDKNKQQCAKMKRIYEGPYKIENENAKNSYVLKDPESNEIRGIFNIEQVYKFEE